MKVLVATEKPFAPAAVQEIRKIVEANDYELVLLEKYTDKAQLIEAVADVDAMIIRSDKATKEVLDAAKNLKVIVRAGAGYDNIDIAAATANNVVAMNTPGQNSNAVAELVFGMMVYNARSNFNGKAGTELRCKKLGIHAYGNVGRNVARIAKGFGMDVYAFDPFVSSESLEKEGIKPMKSAEELYKTCQYISLHIPSNKETKESIDFDLLSKMPKNGVLVNTARAEVIDEQGVLNLLEARKDLSYLSDIAPKRRAEFEEKFASQILFTPKKMGAQTAEANINAGIAAANQIANLIKNGDKTFQVN